MTKSFGYRMRPTQYGSEEIAFLPDGRVIQLYDKGNSSYKTLNRGVIMESVRVDLGKGDSRTMSIYAVSEEIMNQFLEDPANNTIGGRSLGRVGNFGNPPPKAFADFDFDFSSKDSIMMRPDTTRGDYSGTIYYEPNNYDPTITLTTTNNRTLYENAVLTISGNAKDTDKGDVVSVKHSINNGTTRAISTAISQGTDIPFNKSLTFKQGKLYDGSTAITSNLSDGTQHILRVWAEDDQGGKSTVLTRNFYVVNNRPATLTINPFSAREDLIDTDYITIDGSVTDPDGNDMTVKYKIGNSSFSEVYKGKDGDFQFQVQLNRLSDGKNTLTIEVEDSYGAKAVKTLEITKNKDEVALKTAVARYKLSPPNGTAKGVVLWIEREVGDLVVDAEISMGANGEEENFVKMTKSSTAFVSEGIEEDEFIFEADAEKENIILKITMNRDSTSSNKGITLISGVLS